MKMNSPDYLHIYLLTFNCGRELINAEAFAPHLFDALKDPIRQQATTHLSLPDVLVLNLQEVAPIAYSFLGGSFLTPYFDVFRQMVDLATEEHTERNNDLNELSGYVNVLTRNLGLTAIMVFVRADLVSQINAIMTAGVGVGVHETGNKGAVGARISWALEAHRSNNDTPGHDETLDLTFVSAHLAPMEEELQRRHQDFKDIAKGLVFTTDTESVPSAKSAPKSTATATTENSESTPLLAESSTTAASQETLKLHPNPDSVVGMYTSPSYLFFAGDLNYRTSQHPPSTADVPSFPQLDIPPTHPNHYTHLLKRDQLTHALNNGETLHGLSEPQITFPPTYKYKYQLSGSTPSQQPIINQADTQSWSFAPHRWPSWCDRILFFQPSHDHQIHLVQPGKYTSLPMFTTSDHRPVALSVHVPLVAMPEGVGRELENAAPVPVDMQWRARRDAARRREIVVGLASYLGLTREGNALVFGGLAAVVGGLLIARTYGV